MVERSFMDMIEKAAREVAAENDVATILPEAAVMTLRETAARYIEQLNGPRFSPGDLVTPVAAGSLKGAGEPHIVLEVRAGVEPFWNPCQGSSHTSQGARLDTRVANFIRSDEVSPFWCESFEFERWTDKTEAGR